MFAHDTDIIIITFLHDYMINISAKQCDFQFFGNLMTILLARFLGHVKTFRDIISLNTKKDHDIFMFFIFASQGIQSVSPPFDPLQH